MNAPAPGYIERAVRLFGWTADLAAIEDLSPRLRLLRFEGERLKRLAWSPGDKVKVLTPRPGGAALRSYTPARVDPDAGRMDVVFFRHGGGPGSALASEAQIGQRVTFLGPKASAPAATAPADWALFLGDESTLGLARALLDALPDRPGAQPTRILGAIELAADDAPAIGALGLGALDPAIRGGARGEALRRWLAGAALPSGDGVAWLSGHADSACALRDALLARGVPGASIHYRPYWGRKKDRR